MMELIQNNIIEILATVITAVASFIGVSIKKAYTKYVDTKTKKEIVEATVKYIEQIYKARPSKDVLDGLGVLFCCFQRETPKCAVCPLHRLCAAVAYSQSNFFGRFSALHYHGMGDAHP